MKKPGLMASGFSIMHIHEELQKVISGIYYQPLAKNYWARSIACIAEFMQACDAALLNINYNTNRPSIELYTQSGPGIYSVENNAFPYFSTESHVGELIELTTLEYFHDTSSIQPVKPYTLALTHLLCLGVNDGQHLALGLKFLTLPQPLDIRQRAAHISSHIFRALKIQHKINHLNDINQSLIESLNIAQVPFFILDRQLRISYKSSESERLMRRYKAISISKSGGIRLQSSKDQTKLNGLLDLYLNRSDATTLLESTSMPVNCPDLDQPLRICLLPPTQMQIQNHSCLLLITIIDPNKSRILNGEYLKQAYSLTPAEILVAQLFCNGYSINDIALNRNISLNTARWQVKQLLSKTQTHSQSELMHLLVTADNTYIPTQITQHKFFSEEIP